MKDEMNVLEYADRYLQQFLDNYKVAEDAIRQEVEGLEKEILKETSELENELNEIERITEQYGLSDATRKEKETTVYEKCGRKIDDLIYNKNQQENTLAKLRESQQEIFGEKLGEVRIQLEDAVSELRKKISMPLSYFEGQIYKDIEELEKQKKLAIDSERENGTSEIAISMIAANFEEQKDSLRVQLDQLYETRQQDLNKMIAQLEKYVNAIAYIDNNKNKLITKAFDDKSISIKDVLEQGNQGKGEQDKGDQGKGGQDKGDQGNGGQDKGEQGKGGQGQLKSFKIEITKDGSRFVILRDGEEEPITGNWHETYYEGHQLRTRGIYFERANENMLEMLRKHGDKFIIDQIIHAVTSNQITFEEGRNQLNSYLSTLLGKETKNSQFELTYDLRGIVRSGMTRDQKKYVIQKAKEARKFEDKANITVKPGFFRGLLWNVEDKIKLWNKNRALPEGSNESKMTKEEMDNKKELLRARLRDTGKVTENQMQGLNAALKQQDQIKHNIDEGR